MAPEHAHEITFFVNTQPVVTDQGKLKGREILALSKNLPVEEFKLERINGEGNKTVIDLDQTVEVHQHEKFSALFQGPTGLS